MSSAMQSSSKVSSSSLRQHVIQDAFRKCFICNEETAPEAAHLIDASEQQDLSTVNAWKEMGLLPADFGINSHENMVCLCSNCHTNFDSPYPYLLLLPQLSRFIEHERNDYEERIRKAAEGIQQPRTIPGGDHSCDVFFFRQALRIAQFAKFPKLCPASPVAMILKAVQGGMFPYPREPIKDTNYYTGMPPEVRRDLAELIALWERPQPKLALKKRKREVSVQSQAQPPVANEWEFGPSRSSTDNARVVTRSMRAYGNLDFG
ncbi:hypothetical protein KEM55_006985 [Ascosphaera atra]|nr:hypothetical protein KEM55_006985 [Ascosphaera atra]